MSADKSKADYWETKEGKTWAPVTCMNFHITARPYQCGHTIACLCKICQNEIF